jgi:hypothetical protein
MPYSISITVVPTVLYVLWQLNLGATLSDDQIRKPGSCTAAMATDTIRYERHWHEIRGAGPRNGRLVLLWRLDERDLR